MEGGGARGRSIPFSAIVGQLRLQSALLISSIEPAIGGVLVRGAPGTGKSMAVRSFERLLPEIRSVDGCSYNCDAEHPGITCESCRKLFAEGKLELVWRKTPFITLPIGTTEDRLLGTVDLQALLKDGTSRVIPGLLAQAHRGFLYLDEVNLVPDHLLDALLDAASSGVHRVEREGLSLSHPASFSLIGTMNPSEGHLRPQILDRFGLCVDVEGVRDVTLRVHIMNCQLDADGDTNTRRLREIDSVLSKQILAARALLPQVNFRRADTLRSVAAITAELGVESHRADIVILRSAAAIAALAQRTEVNSHDVAIASALALAHRCRDPREVLRTVNRRLGLDDAFDSLDKLLISSGEPWRTLVSANEAESSDPDDGPQDGLSGEPSGSHDSGTTSKQFNPGGGFDATSSIHSEVELPAVRALVLELRSISRLTSAIRLSTRPWLLERMGRTSNLAPLCSGSAVGGAAASILPMRIPGCLAILATVRTAIFRLLSSGALATKLLPLELLESDVVRRARQGRPNIARVFVLDASWSMGKDGSFHLARELIRHILLESRRGDRLALVVAGGVNAHLAIPFGKYSEPINDLVQRLRPRGRTPLLEGLTTALLHCRNRWLYKGCATPMVVVVSDGYENRTSANSAAVSAAIAPHQRVPGVIVGIGDGASGALHQSISAQTGWRIIAL